MEGASTVKVLTGVWNICGLDPAAINQVDLVAVLKQWVDETLCDGADLICAGLVEVIEIKALNVVRETLSEVRLSEALVPERLRKWLALLVGLLEETHDLITEVTLVGLALFVFKAKSPSAPAFSLRKAQVFKTGFFGTMGNKGAVAVSLDVIFDAAKPPASLCVVHAHLASDPEQLGTRNGEYNTIVNAAKNSQLISLAAINGEENILDVLPHDLVIWMGDLNYRLDEPAQATRRAAERNVSNTIISAFAATPLANVGWFSQNAAITAAGEANEAAKRATEAFDARVRELVHQGDWAELARYDQLDTARSRGDAFGGFQEAARHFAPTYKLIRGTTEYVAKRRPAWCDRVLWRLAPSAHARVEVVVYDALSDCVLSDHFPVRAALEWQL